MTMYVVNMLCVNMYVVYKYVFTKLSLEFTKKFEKFASALRAEATLYIGRVAFLISSCIMENFPWNMPVYVHAY